MSVFSSRFFNMPRRGRKGRANRGNFSPTGISRKDKNRTEKPEEIPPQRTQRSQRKAVFGRSERPSIFSRAQPQKSRIFSLRSWRPWREEFFGGWLFLCALCVLCGENGCGFPIPDAAGLRPMAPSNLEGGPQDAGGIGDGARIRVMLSGGAPRRSRNISAQRDG